MSDIVLYKIAQAEETLKDKFKSIDDIALYNQKKVLEAFRETRLQQDILPEPQVTDTTI